MRPRLQPTHLLFLLAISWHLSLGVAGVVGVSRTYTETCALWNALYNPGAQNWPQWVGGDPAGTNCSDYAVGTMIPTDQENVMDQFNLLRMLAGLPNVTTNATKNNEAQIIAWSSTHNYANCYTSLRLSWFNTYMSVVTVTGGLATFDVMGLFLNFNAQQIFDPTLNSIGLGAWGNVTAGRADQVLYIRNDSTMSTEPASPSTCFAFPPDGVIERGSVSNLDKWRFATTQPLASNTTLVVLDLSDNFTVVSTTFTLLQLNGWYWVNFVMPSGLITEGKLFQVEISSGQYSWTYQPHLTNCSLGAICGDGFCQETENAATCPVDCLPCGAMPLQLASLPTKCVDGTWLMSGDLQLAADEVFDAGNTALSFMGSLTFDPTSTLLLSAAGGDLFGSVKAQGCGHLDGSLVFNLNFEVDISKAYNFTLVSFSGGECANQTKRFSGSSFGQVKVNFTQNSACPPNYKTQSSSDSYAVLLQPTSGCGSGNGLLIGLTAGLVGGAAAVVAVIIVGGLAYIWVRNNKRKRATLSMHEKITKQLRAEGSEV